MEGERNRVRYGGTERGRGKGEKVREKREMRRSILAH